MSDAIARHFPARAERQDDPIAVDPVALDRHRPPGGQEHDLGLRLARPGAQYERDGRRS